MPKIEDFFGQGENNLRTIARLKKANFEKDKEGVINDLEGHIAAQKNPDKIEEEIKKVKGYADWKGHINGFTCSNNKNKKELEEKRKQLCDYANILLALISIENRLLKCEEGLNLEENRKLLDEILKFKDKNHYKEAFGLQKDGYRDLVSGKTYQQIVEENIRKLDQKIENDKKWDELLAKINSAGTEEGLPEKSDIENLDNNQLTGTKFKEKLLAIWEIKKEMLGETPITNEKLNEELQAGEGSFIKKGESWQDYILNSDNTVEHVENNKNNVLTYGINGLRGWNNFFQENGIDTSNKNKKLWKKTGLSPVPSRSSTSLVSTAQEAFNKGWTNLSLDNKSEKISLIPNSRKINYTSYGEISQEVDLLKVKKDDLDSLHQRIKNVKEEKDIAKLEIYTVDYIRGFRNEEYPQETVNNFQNLVEQKRTDTWKKFFAGKAELREETQRQAWKETGLNPSQIETRYLLKFSQCDKAWIDNGWRDISTPEYTNRGENQLTYTHLGTEVRIKLLEHKKKKVDEACQILADIKNGNKASNLEIKSGSRNNFEKRIKDLKDEALPTELQVVNLTQKLKDKFLELYKQEVIENIKTAWESQKAKISGLSLNQVLENENWEENVNSKAERVEVDNEIRSLEDKIIKAKNESLKKEISEIINSPQDQIPNKKLLCENIWNKNPCLVNLIALKEALFRAEGVWNTLVPAENEIQREIKSLKSFEDYKKVKDNKHKSFHASFSWREYNRQKGEEAQKLFDKLDALGKLYSRIKGNSLPSLQEYIPQANDPTNKISLTGNNLSEAKIAAYTKLKDSVDERELKLLIEQALRQDDEGKNWGHTLTDEEKDQIRNAADKERLKAAQKDIREKNATWNNFFSQHGINDKKDKKEWQDNFSNHLEAEQVYTNALTSLPDFPWSRTLSTADQGKIKQAKSRSDITKKQKEVAWDQFFQGKGIEKKYWVNWEECGNVKNANKLWDNGWRKTEGYGKDWDKDVWDCKGHGETIKKANPSKHKKSEITKLEKLLSDINNADLTTLRAIVIGNIVYEESFVPNDYSYTKVQELKYKKELELFKNNFETSGTPGIAITLNEAEEWLKTGLGGNGNNEKIAFDNGWTKPNEINHGKIATYVTTVRGKNLVWNNINVLEVKEKQLELALDLLDEINSRNTVDKLNELADNRNGELQTLTNDHLPPDLETKFLGESFTNKFGQLTKKEFIDGFRSQGGNASFASDSQILDYFSALIPETKREGFKEFGQKAGQSFKNGWTDPTQIRMDRWGKKIKVKFGKYLKKNGRKKEWNAVKLTRREVENRIWYRDFYLASPLSGTWNRTIEDPDKETIINYKKGNIPFLVARQVFENHWQSDQFNWNGTRAFIENCHSEVNGLDANKIDRKEWEKVVDIEKRINLATIVGNLPNQTEINGIIEDKVPTSKKRTYIQSLYDSKKTSLNRGTADQQARQNAIQVVKNHWSLLKMNEPIKNILNNGWENNFATKTGNEITNYENELKNLISAAKVKPDIAEIEAELNKKPSISSSELKTSYRSEMINLAADETKKNNLKSEIIAEIAKIRTGKLEVVREIIANAQNIKDKDGATKEELETAINDLKTLTSAPADSAEKIVWEAKKAENEKLLTDLEAKLLPEPEKEQEGPDKPKPQIPTPPPSPTPAEEVEKFGEDYVSLKPTQQEGRQKIVENWKKEVNYDRSKTCRHCPQEFHYDKSLEFLVAKAKVENELKKHEENCVTNMANSEKAKEVKQNCWEQIKQVKVRYFYACRKCWGKIELDKKFTDWDQAKKHAIADLAYHEEHECGQEGTKKIAIYFSPNQGGNEHAPLTYAAKIKEEELTLEQDNQGEIYQEKIDDKKPVDWTPWLIIGGGVILVSGLLFFWMINKKKRKI